MPARVKDRIRLHLTRPGWVYVAVVLLLGFAAGRNGAVLMFGMFGCLIGAVAYSAISAWRMLRKVEVHRELPERDWQYRTIHVGYYLHNRGRGSVLGLEVAEIAPAGVETAAGYGVSIPAGGGFRAGGRLVARRRGRIELPGIELRTRFPFGLVCGVRRVPAAATIVIWPARGSLRRPLLARGAAQTSSAAPSRASGGQDEFFGLREYRRDDNPRWIHWKRSASSGTLVVRELARARPEVLWIVLDAHPGAPGETMLRFAATLADHAFARGYRVGLAMAGRGGVKLLAPGPGRGRRAEVLDALAQYEAGAGGGLGQTLELLRRRRLSEAQVVVISGEASSARGALPRVTGLTLIDADAMGRAFQDDPAAAGEGPCP
ncbi:MAG: DUF58 domain-containing protein [Planctomycetota bacterium]|nr:DUF58 domain-containing protein [Planctomycetota bacterium]